MTRNVLLTIAAFALSLGVSNALATEHSLRIACTIAWEALDGAGTSATRVPLSGFVWDRAPWEHIEANSDQRHPYYVGASPGEMRFNGKRQWTPTIRAVAKEAGEWQARRLRNALGVENAEFEAWPALNDQGDVTWVFARWRESPSHAWKWLDESLWKPTRKKDKYPAPLLPRTLRPWIPKERNELFTDFLQLDSLYAKPAFGDAIWTSVDGKKVHAAYLPTEAREAFSNELGDRKDIVGRIIAQPARFNAKPITFTVHLEGDHVTWPKTLRWVADRSTTLPKLNGTIPDISFAKNFLSEYKKDVERLGGERNAWFPDSRRVERFVRKSSAQPDNQLGAVCDYLTARYEKLKKKYPNANVQIIRQEFEWRGIKQYNLAMVIPGKRKGKDNHPVLYSDHIDTVFAEDEFAKTGNRVTVAGADDNVSATAALLRAAETLVPMADKEQPEHDIVLLHLTGEEFPADDLGVRHFLSRLLYFAGRDHTKAELDKDPLSKWLTNRGALQGMVLNDMIGYHNLDVRGFQVNAGYGSRSLRLAAVTMAAAAKYAPDWRVYFRPRFDHESYLYNTDGLILDNMGVPVVFLDEEINRENIDTANPHYHQTTDVSANMDMKYATDITKTGIASLWYLANEKLPP